jgi:hypothetical protein
MYLERLELLDDLRTMSEWRYSTIHLHDLALWIDDKCLAKDPFSAKLFLAPSAIQSHNLRILVCQKGKVERMFRLKRIVGRGIVPTDTNYFRTEVSQIISCVTQATREQINERVRQLEELAKQQRNNISPRR